MEGSYQQSEKVGSVNKAAANQLISHGAVYPAVPAVQKKSPEEEELQMKASSITDDVSQRKEQVAPPRINRTGMPDQLKSGIENLSGFSMDDVKVHYNSSQPAQLNALAYAQGTNIHIAPGQERHLPHEAWHVVQQKQGRVRPTMQMKDVAINDDKGLEREADVMGGRALQRRNVIQRKEGDDISGTQEIIPEEKKKLEDLGGAIQAKLKGSSINNMTVQRAYTARRPLGGKVSFGLKSRWFHNKGVFHEHIFFQDGVVPGDIGFHNGSPSLFEDAANMRGMYQQIKVNLDDAIMRQAVRDVGDPGTYSLLGNNCQAYVERVLNVYDGYKRI